MTSFPAYRIERVWIPQYPAQSREVYFLDRMIYTNGRTSSSNICSGTQDYCWKRLAELNREEYGQ